MNRSLHALVQECSRAIASYASPQGAFSEIERIAATATGAISVAVTTAKEAGATNASRDAFHERRVCVVVEREQIFIAAPIKDASRIFGVLVARYNSRVERIIGGHSLSEVVNAVAQVLGNALALAEEVPEGSTAVLRYDAYEHYLRAHFRLYRSFNVPFTIALYDLRQHTPDSRAPHAVALRWSVRKSDAVFEIDEGIFVVLLATCPLPNSRIATERIEQITGFAAQALTAPRRGESFPRLRERSTLLTPATNEPVPSS